MNRTQPHEATNRVTTVLIVDDHPDFRREARALLEDEGVGVVGEAADGRSALDTVAALRPDVVLLDVGLPDMDGFEVALRLADATPPPAVVLVSSRDVETYGSRVAGSRAAGFVRKDELSLDAVAALVATLVARRGPRRGG